MNPQQQFCPNNLCHASGKESEGNIVIHSRRDQRYKCKCCGRTFSATKGTAFYGLKKPTELFVLVITLLAHGCPVQAIVAAFGLDERTVTLWLHRGGRHCQQLHDHLVGENQLDLGQVQADEIKVKTQHGTLWMAMALMVPTRLWLGGVVSPRRDLDLIQQLVAYIRAVALCRPLLLAVDGLASYVKAFQRAFRSPLRLGQRGAPRKIPWAQVAIVQVVKRRNGNILTIERRIVQGCEHLIAPLLRTTQPGCQINTAYIERLNATFRQRLTSLVRRTRALARTPRTVEAGMFLLGCVYNFSTWHKSLRLPLFIAGAGRRWVQRTPAMAAGLTDHCWTIRELLHFKVPTPFQPPKRRGRPRKLVCSCSVP